MIPRYLLLGIADAVTTFLLAGALTFEILGTWYGETPGVDILGLGVGAVVSLLIDAVVTFTGDRLSGLRATMLVADGGVRRRVPRDR